MKKGLIITLLFVTVLLTACSRTQIGWVATNVGDTFEASYRRFDGREVETFQLVSGESFSLTYDVEVDEGTLSFELFNPEDEIIWEETFTEDAQETFALSPETSGRYQLHIIGDETRGDFDLNWDISD